MSAATPPTHKGPLARLEARLAWSLLLPTIAIVSMVVVLPLLAIFWISFKPIGLADLRPVAPVAREDLRNPPLRWQKASAAPPSAGIKGKEATEGLPSGTRCRWSRSRP